MSSSTKDAEGAGKFLFDAHDFSPEAIERENRRQAELAHKTRFTEDDIEAAKQQGFADGQKEARAQQESLAADCLKNMEAGLGTLISNETTRVGDMEAQACHIAVVAVKKLLPSLFREKAQEDIEALIAQTLQERHDEPRIVARVHPDMLQPLSERVDALAQSQGFAGKVMILADENLTLHSDCKVEWADGGAERLIHVLFSKIEETLLKEAGPLPEKLAAALEEDTPDEETASDVAETPGFHENDTDENDKENQTEDPTT